MQANLGPVGAPKRIALGLALWFIAELCAFAFVVSAIGLSGALLLGLITSLAGFSLLRRLGRDAASSLRQVFGSQGMILKPESMVDNTIAAVGGALLVLPGFLSDAIGLALAAPSIRLWLARRFNSQQPSWVKGTNQRSSSQVIDLGAQEWRRLEDTAPDMPSRS